MGVVALNLLALESASENCSVALWCDGRQFVRRAASSHPHSEVLVTLVRTIVSDAGITLRQLDAIAFGMGPGAFTGLRLACGIAQGLALGLHVPVVPVSTLLAMAHGTEGDRVLTMLDARMGQVYLAAYVRSASGWSVEIQPALHDLASLPALSSPQWLPVGSGAELYASRLGEVWPDRLLPVRYGVIPDAGSVAALAVQDFLQHRAIPADQAVPLYLRNKVALTRAERSG